MMVTVRGCPVDLALAVSLNSPVASFIRAGLYRAALVQIGSGEWVRTSILPCPLDHVWIELGHQLFRIFDLTNAAIKLSPFCDREFLMCDVALYLGRRLQLDAHRPDAAANAAMNFDGLSGHHPDNRSFLGDDDMLAVNISAHVAIHLQLVLGDDGDAVPKNGQVGADD